MPAPQSSHVDGQKVWMQNNGFAIVHRLDLATGKMETFEPFRDAKEGENHNIYDVIPDSKNNAYFTDFANQQIGRIDAKTGKITLYQMPTHGAAPPAGPRWTGRTACGLASIAETGSRRCSTPRRNGLRSGWRSSPWSAPYDVALDKAGHAWTGSMGTDRVLRLDPKTGQFTEYLLPRPTNIRRVFVDDSGARPTLWVGSNHGASIIKLEPLE